MKAELKKSCSKCKYADWDADGCTCMIEKRLIGNAFAYVCDNFSSAKSFTNGDRIRQMDDEELAEELTSLITNALHSPAIFYGKATEEQITAANLKWLKQDATEQKQFAEKLVKSFCPDDVFTLPGMVLTREELDAICLLSEENEEE